VKRFWSKVDKNGPVPECRPDLGPCWEWLAGLGSATGYGNFWLDGRTVSAHRFAYIDVLGPVPDGLDLDHLCRNRGCVNPHHLEPVTETVNILRGTSPMARNARKTSCIHGHAFTPENTYVDKRGRRTCCLCRDLAVIRYLTKKVEQRLSH
jgi:HNH endonuclease